ncbi:MAG: hypothetical protein ACXVAX_05470 [Pseudobdellovibrio sp.]
MKKVILIFVLLGCLVILKNESGMGSVSSTEVTRNLTNMIPQTPKTVQEPAKAAEFVNYESQFKRLSLKELKTKIADLNDQLMRNSTKSFDDFSKSELEGYINLNRQKVVLTKIMIQKKYQGRL